MIKKLIAFLVGFSIFFMAWNVAYAGTQTWDFGKADAAKDWKTVTGNWEVKDGSYQLIGKTPAMHSLVGNPKWTDYVVEAKVRIDRNNWAGIVVRAQSDFEYYVYYMNVPDNKSELWLHSKPNIDTRKNLAQIPAKDGVKIERGKFINVKVVAEGDKLQLWVEGKLQHEGTDKTYPAGQAGVWAWDTDASFDDVKVTGKDIAGGVAVQPAGKLATTWGRMRAFYR